MHQSLSCINSQAVAYLKASKHIEAIVAFDKLFKRLAKKHLTHADLHTCYNNRAVAFLHLHLYDEALQDAEQARKLAEAALKRLFIHSLDLLNTVAWCACNTNDTSKNHPDLMHSLAAGHPRLLVHMLSPLSERPAPLSVGPSCNP